MKVIRKSIFETNSSSSHSLSLGTLVGMPDGDQNGCQITLGDGEYGWEWGDYDSWLDKADYITVDANGDTDKLEMIEKAIKEVYPNAEINWSTSGYIDHDSDGTFWYDNKDYDAVKTFIWGDGGFSTGNDNEEGSQQY